MAISIKTTPNDVGLRDLKTENEQPANARETDPVPPYPRTRERRFDAETPEREREQGKQERPQTERRVERRTGGDRRKRDVPVFLDTRNNRERRVSQHDRRGDAEPTAAAKPKGIDINV